MDRKTGTEEQEGEEKGFLHGSEQIAEEKKESRKETDVTNQVVEDNKNGFFLNTLRYCIPNMQS